MIALLAIFFSKLHIAEYFSYNLSVNTRRAIWKIYIFLAESVNTVVSLNMVIQIQVIGIHACMHCWCKQISLFYIGGKNMSKHTPYVRISLMIDIISLAVTGRYCIYKNPSTTLILYLLTLHATSYITAAQLPPIWTGDDGSPVIWINKWGGWGAAATWIHYKEWDEITYPFPNVNDATVEVGNVYNIYIYEI